MLDLASAIGKPIHIDEATANKRRLDFACVCVEINAGDELPIDIAILVKDESVMVGIEYQRLPPRCEKCKVFGHTCDVKVVPKATSHVEEWTVVGKDKLSSTDKSVVDSTSLPVDLSQKVSDFQTLIGAVTAIGQGVEHPWVPSNAAGEASSSNAEVPNIIRSSPLHTTSFNPQPLELQSVVPPVPSDDTLSEKMDEEILIIDKEKEPLIAQEKSNGVSINGTPATSREPAFPESNSSRKRRMKKERKLRIQGSR